MKNEMTTRERITAAIKHEPVDKIPISPRFKPQLYGYSEYNIRALVDFKKKYFHFDPHVPWSYPANLNTFKKAIPEINNMNDVNMTINIDDKGETIQVTTVFQTPAGKLQQIRIQPKPDQKGYGDNPNPHIAEFLVKDKDDLEKINYLIPIESSYSLGDFFELEKHYWDEAVLMPSICGPMDHTGGNFCDMCNLMVAYYEDREFFDRYFDIFTEFTLSQLRWVLDRGAKHIFLAWFYESLSSGWSPLIYKEVFAPIIKKEVDLIHEAEGLACFYDDGKLMDSLPYIVETGVDCIETCTPSPMGDFDIAEAKRLYGDQVAFKGGMDIVNVIWQGTPELIDHTMREYVNIGSRGSGFLIGTCDTIRPETPRENADAFFKAANRYAVR